ncbi:hypothetical protein [Endozoicomonas ascidiicola]|nr:hypothetical protein [Endozoicomonas ascidiicola]
MQADGFCKNCWYPGIDADWKQYQLRMDTDYDQPTPLTGTTHEENP